MSAGAINGSIHRGTVNALAGAWIQAVFNKKPWTRIKFVVPFILVFSTVPTSVTFRNIYYDDCSDLRVDQITTQSFTCSVLYTGSWDIGGQVAFEWDAAVEGY